MAGKNVNISKSDLRHVIFERSMPVNLKKGQAMECFKIFLVSLKIVLDGAEPLS